MIKTLHILTSVITVFIVSLFFLPDQSVSVTQSALDEAVPGQEFEVELTINKGNIDGFARLQELPVGFTATPVFMGSAKFTFENQYVELVWFALPQEPSFTVTYKITVDSNVTADTKTLAGIFSYIEKDKTKTIDVTTTHIKISKMTGESAYAKNAINKDEGNGDVSASADAIQIDRNVPDHISPDKDFLVELTVRNSSIHGSAKIVEHIPDGWVAEKGEVSGALFKVQDSSVKFIWLAMPKDSVFKISYHVKPGKNIKALQSIYGTFAFEDRGTPRSFDYFPSQIALAENDPVPSLAQKNPGDPVGAAIKKSLNQDPPSQEALLAMATNTPSPETGVKYKVQIAACKRDVKDVHYFNQHYQLQEPVSAEMHEGWHKFVIGSFDTYRNAHDMRVNTSERVNGAFVVAYNNGVRVTVREALTVSRQKWLQ